MNYFIYYFTALFTFFSFNSISYASYKPLLSQEPQGHIQGEKELKNADPFMYEFLTSPLKNDNGSVTFCIDRITLTDDNTFISMGFLDSSYQGLKNKLNKYSTVLYAHKTKFGEKLLSKLWSKESIHFIISSKIGKNTYEWNLYSKKMNYFKTKELYLRDSLAENPEFIIERTKNRFKSTLIKTKISFMNQKTNSPKLTFNHKKPKWNESCGGWSLDTDGIKGIGSEKTLVISDRGVNVFTLVRQKNGSFIVRIRAPFSPLHGFALALSTL